MSPEPAPFTPARVATDRLTLNVWSAGPPHGTPLLLVHGNLTTGGFWRYVAQELPDDIRVIAPDLRGFGATDAEPVDATRGLGDMSDDLHALLEALGLAGQRGVHAVGWSMGGGVLQRMMLDHGDDLATVTLVAPMSPYGFGGSTDAGGTRAYPDDAGTGGGGASPAFVQRLASQDRREDEPTTSPRVIMRTFYGAGANAANVDEEFLLTELLSTRTGPGFYPGASTPSGNWPMRAPGDDGILNAMSPRHFGTADVIDAAWKPPVLWLRGERDQVVSDASMFDFGTLGKLGVVPGWPGEQVLPPQPMDAQTRAVFTEYAARGGEFREVALDSAHGLPLEVPARVAAEIVQHVRR